MWCAAEEEEGSDSQHQQQHHRQQQQHRQHPPAASAAETKLQAFLSGRKGNKGIKTAAAQPSQQQIAEQQRQQQQQRLLERKLKKQFMSSKVSVPERQRRQPTCTGSNLRTIQMHLHCAHTSHAWVLPCL
jgi:hypothetical protein